MRKIALIVNGNSRRGADEFETAKEEFRKHGAELHGSLLGKSKNETRLQIREWINSGFETIVVGGGDGSLNLAAQELVNGPAIMGVLPLGTGNAFARDLAIPANTAEAVRIVLEGKPESVDVGRVNGQIFLNVATIGFATEIARGLRKHEKRWLGKLAYALALKRALPRFKAFDASLKCPELDVEFEAAQIVLGCGRFHAGPLTLSPYAGVSSGLISFYAVQPTQTVEIFEIAMGLLSGEHIDHPDVLHCETAGGSITTKPGMVVTIDGEEDARTPIEFEVHPGGLKVWRSINSAS